MKSFGKVEELRRKTVITAAGAAVLAAGPALSMTHGHRWLGVIFIAIQSVLIVWLWCCWQG
jgi:hypothetical protein